jgi:hypothetical protein
MGIASVSTTPVPPGGAGPDLEEDMLASRWAGSGENIMTVIGNVYQETTRATLTELTDHLA